MVSVMGRTFLSRNQRNRVKLGLRIVAWYWGNGQVRSLQCISKLLPTSEFASHNIEIKNQYEDKPKGTGFQGDIIPKFARAGAALLCKLTKLRKMQLQESETAKITLKRLEKWNIMKGRK